MKLKIVITCLLGLWVINTFTSCDSGQTTNVPEVSQDVSSKHEELQAEVSNLYDTTFTNGYFLRYVLDTNNVIHIIWGNQEFERSKIDEDYPGWAPSEFETEYEGFIGLFHSCGSCPCRTHILLPKNKTDSIEYYESHYATSAEHNLIFYRTSYSDGKDKFLIENIVTKKKQTIQLDSICGYPSACSIKRSNFAGKMLYVKWRNDCREASKENSFEHTFEINNEVVINTTSNTK